MKSRPILILFVCMTVMLFSVIGYAQQGTIDKYRSASLDGVTGLFKTWDADTLRKGEFNFTIGYDHTNRDPGQLTIGRGVTGISFGLHDRLEVFGSWDYLRHIDEDNVGYYRPYSYATPTLATTPAGAQFFNQIAPFMNSPYANGNSDFQFGAKVNLMSERKGNPVSMGIAGVFHIPGRTDAVGLNRGLSSGAYGGGFSWLLSKTLSDMARIHVNIGTNFYSDTELNGTTLLKLQKEFTYRGGVEFPVYRAVRGIAELSGISYFGDAEPGMNPASPIDVILGVRAYPATWMSIGGGYQASLNHVEDGEVAGALGAGYNGFVVQTAFGKRRNDPPTVSCACANPRILQEDSTSVRANSVDPEGDTLTYAWNTTGGKITGSGDTVTFDTADAAPGVYDISVRVSDGKNETECNTQITVLKKNYPPTVTIDPASSSVVQGESQVLNAKASDRNKDPLTYTWTVDGQKLAASGPQITFGSEGRNPGNYNVKVEVSDGEATADSTAVVTVREKPNKLPTIECLTAAIEVKSGETVSLNARASDPEGGALKYSWSSPVGKINGSGATVTFDAAGVKSGSYNITVTVEDPRGGKASCTMTVNVSERLSVTKDKCGYFAYQGARVDNCAKAILDDLSVRMKNEPQLRANIIGYVDGKYEVSMTSLGERRAKAVAAYLEKKGVEASRLSTTNGGAADPVGDNNTSAGRKLNRRAVIELSVR